MDRIISVDYMEYTYMCQNINHTQIGSSILEEGKNQIWSLIFNVPSQEEGWFLIQIVQITSFGSVDSIGKLDIVQKVCQKVFGIYDLYVNLYRTDY